MSDEEELKQVSSIVLNVASSIDNNIRKSLGDETVINMIVFLFKEISANEDIMKSSNNEGKFYILLEAFNKKFAKVLNGKNIAVPIFLGYLLEKIDNTLTEVENREEINRNENAKE